jgi:hypothetical protein
MWELYSTCGTSPAHILDAQMLAILDAQMLAILDAQMLAILDIAQFLL